MEQIYEKKNPYSVEDIYIRVSNIVTVDLN